MPLIVHPQPANSVRERNFDTQENRHVQSHAHPCLPKSYHSPLHQRSSKAST